MNSLLAKEADNYILFWYRTVLQFCKQASPFKIKSKQS